MTKVSLAYEVSLAYALIYAIIFNDYDNAKIFIEKSPNLNFIVNFILNRNDNEDLTIFLDKDAENKNSSYEYSTPIIYIAIQFGRLKIVKLLINNGAQTFFPNYGGSSLLSYAAKFDQTQICEYLIENNFHMLSRIIYFDCLIEWAQTIENNRLVNLFTKLLNDSKLNKMLFLILDFIENKDMCVYQIKHPDKFKGSNIPSSRHYYH